MELKVELKDRFPEIIAGSVERVSAAVDKAAQHIETGCKDRSRVDTGNMRGGWEHEKLSEHSAIVFNLVDYTIYNEYGTVNMAAQPMLTPSVEETKESFIREVRDAYVV